MSIWNDIWELFFPRYCVLCGERLAKTEECVCIKCFIGLPRTRMCPVADNAMEKEFWGKLPIERANSLLYYTKGGDVQKILYELKYYGNDRLALFLGKCMAMELQPSNFFQNIDYILPVPLHDKKKKARGYNQSEMIAQGISIVTGIPLIDNILKRVRYTDTQTKKRSYERWLNVQDVFECISLKIIEDKHVLLVDDVMTTGSTIVACADALSGIPHIRISVLTLALTSAS